MNLPLPGWLPAALLPASLVPGTAATAASTSLLQLNLKWAVRRAALAIGAAMLLYAFFTHRDYERESYKCVWAVAGSCFSWWLIAAACYWSNNLVIASFVRFCSPHSSSRPFSTGCCASWRRSSGGGTKSTWSSSAAKRLSWPPCWAVRQRAAAAASTRHLVLPHSAGVGGQALPQPLQHRSGWSSRAGSSRAQHSSGS